MQLSLLHDKSVSRWFRMVSTLFRYFRFSHIFRQAVVSSYLLVNVLSRIAKIENAYMSVVNLRPLSHTNSLSNILEPALRSSAAHMVARRLVSAISRRKLSDFDLLVRNLPGTLMHIVYSRQKFVGP